MNIKGTKSESNLRAAFGGESMARNKYTFFAEYARSQGHEKIAAAFERMAKNEMAHAKFWFETLYGKNTPTVDNLQVAVNGEHDESYNMYPAFAATAREEGLEDLARMFEMVGNIEKSHEREFLNLIASLTEKSGGQALEEEAVQEKPTHRCQFCGYTTAAREAVCPVCKAIGAWDAIK